MPRIVGIDLFELDLPFRRAFRHAAAERVRSESLFVRCVTDDGYIGFGEALPRPYVTGETRSAAFDLLAQRILPRLIGMSFASFQEVYDFLVRCDGKAPEDWVDARAPQTAAWCAVDLALLDTFGRAFGTNLGPGLSGIAPGRASGSWPDGLGYSVVLSDDSGRRRLTTLLKTRLYGIRDVKVKMTGQSPAGVRLARRILGSQARLRVDSNMAWSYDGARRAMELLGPYGVESCEQPLPADDIEGMARLTADGLALIADESVHVAASLERLIAARACSGVNVRIAKCGGLVASLARCRRVLKAGLTLQIGCQVGETSHLSAAQLVLVRAVGQGITHLEGCYGERLLAIDPVRPLLQFGRGGHPPSAPKGPGFGTGVDLRAIEAHAGRRVSLGTATSNRRPSLAAFISESSKELR
jgi:L-alanine-DL-glutamate epimerase-like enolase superfamily enzyme